MHFIRRWLQGLWRTDRTWLQKIRSLPLLTEAEKAAAEVKIAQLLRTAEERNAFLDHPDESALVKRVRALLGTSSDGEAMLARVFLEVNGLKQGVKRRRPVDDTGDASDMSMSTSSAEEVDAWDHYVAVKNICQVVEPSELLPQERPVVVALRWLSLMVFHAVDCILDKDKILGPDSVTSGTTSARRSSAASKEVPLHHAGLAMYKAAASGQRDLRFEKEDHAPGDSAREDVRCLIKEVSSVPQEFKREFACTSGTDTEGGIGRNRAGFAKALKCIFVKYNDRQIHLCSVAVRLAAVWFVRFTFGTPQQLLGPAVCSYNTLTKVEVTPGFPQTEGEVPLGAICPDADDALRELCPGPGSKTTLAALLAKASAGGSGQPPPGFRMLVRYVDQLCHMFGIDRVEPFAICDGSTGGAGMERVDLSGAEVVYLGSKSLILRLPNADSVLKVAPMSSIRSEQRFYKLLDGGQRPSLRRMTDLRRYGSVEGAHDGLGFLELQHWCEPVSGSLLKANPKLCNHFWCQAEDALLHLEELRILHRDIKPSNFLTHTLHRRVRLLLSDFDLACEEDEAEESSTPVGTAAFWSPWFDMNNPDWTYTRDDDWLGLGLTFGYWLGVYSGSPLPKAAAEQKLRVLSKMLGPAWEEHLPDSFRDRFRPLYAQLRAFHQQQVEVQQE